MKIWLLIFPDPDPVGEGEAACSVKGMRKKVIFYAGMILAGIVGYFLIHYLSVYVFKLPSETVEFTTDDSYARFFHSGTYTLSSLEAIIYLITFQSVTLTPVIRFIPKGSLIVDILYCVSVGYNTAFMYWGVAQSDSRIAWLTLYISIVLCAVPYLLFKIKKIKLSPVFSKIVYVLFWVLVMGSSIFRILSFIPGIGKIAVFFYKLYNIPGAGEFLLVVRIIIYFLFIFMCLDNVIKFVHRKAPAKYEWIMTFHLMYTITILVNYCMLFVMAHTDAIMNGIGALVGITPST